MSLEDLLLLLRQDLSQSFRIKGVKGKRSERRNVLRRLIIPIGAFAVGFAIVYFIVSFGPFLWPFVYSVLASDPGLGATIFNFLMIFAFIGSIMVSATTVANSARMEYLMTMPISLRTLFLEKAIIVIFYNSMLWLVIGTPIFLGLAIVSPYPFALLSVPIFVVGMLILVTLGVAIGGLLGLWASKVFSGRRLLKQIGYAIMSTIGIVGGTLWYVSFYLNQDGGFFIDIFQIAKNLGLASTISPGHSLSVLSIGILIGFPIRIIDLVMPLVFTLLAIGLLYGSAIVSEEAHYSGWLASESKRTSKKEFVIAEREWNPQPMPFVKLNQTTSVSMWYNIASIRRDARVVTQYLLGPIRIVIWIILPGFILGETAFDFTSYFIIAAMIPFATSYGLFFAGYETVYEGKNLMNLQLAATNMQDYVKGKVYSALPFSLAAGVIVSVIILFISPALALFLPAMVLCLVFLTLASGAIAANAAAIGRDFHAERRITRQRGSGVQMPIRGWSILRAQFIPMILGFGGVLGIIAAGIFLNPLIAYLIAPLYLAICYALFRHYSYSAGRKLATIEASKYL
ncbi:MAG: hypothetical protein ACXAEF_15875 [Candidatus Thorarchaeota archaeon]